MREALRGNLLRAHRAGHHGHGVAHADLLRIEHGAALAQPRHVVILDEPTAALGVKEGNMVLELIRRVRDKGLPVILISHNMPHVFEIADRIHIARLGKRACIVNPKKISMSDTVAVMTGAVVHDIEHKGGSDEVVIPKDAPPPTAEEERSDAERAE